MRFSLPRPQARATATCAGRGVTSTDSMTVGADRAGRATMRTVTERKGTGRMNMAATKHTRISPVSHVGRVFTDAKIVDSRALNLVGAQPFRAVLARLLYNLRPGSDDPLSTELAHTGIIVCEGFLPPDEFTTLEREADEYMTENPPTWEGSSGTTQVRHLSLASVDPGRHPQLAQWRSHRQILALASRAERRTCGEGAGGSLLEKLAFGDCSEPDGQSDLHVDTFFSTHKFWLYLDDVSTENGAFVYVPSSHLFDRVRLRYEYLESTASNAKSRRVSDDEVRRRGLERRVFACSRNTLVVANTCGYHCRSVGQAGASRRALHHQFRFNPFPQELWNRAGVRKRAARWAERLSTR